MNLLDESKGKIGFYTGIPVVIVPTTRIQNKTHKKKRINKKWAKRYGFTEYCNLKDGEELLVRLGFLIILGNYKSCILLTERGNKNGIYNSRNRETNKDN